MMKNHKALIKIFSFIIAIALLSYLAVYADDSSLPELKVDQSFTLDNYGHELQQAFDSSAVAQAALEPSGYDPYLYDMDMYE